MPDYPSPALDAYERRNRRGQPNGYATLGPDGRVPATQILDDDGQGGGAGGGGISPAVTVVDGTTPGRPANPGSAANYSRGDHDHGTPPGLLGSGSVVTETLPSQGSSAGVSLAYSRGDHTHGTPGPVESLTSAVLVTGGTIPSTALTSSRVAPTSVCTGTILQAGIVPGQLLVVINESAFTISFAAASTSHVSIGTTATIPALLAMPFIWDSATNLWYCLGNTAGGGPVTSTTYTFTGPGAGLINVASTNFTVMVSPVGSSVASITTVTPVVTGITGTFSPSSVTFSGGFVNALATFTFTPTSNGSGTISVANTGGLTNPASLTYVVSSGAGVYDTAIYDSAIFG